MVYVSSPVSSSVLEPDVRLSLLVERAVIIPMDPVLLAVQAAGISTPAAARNRAASTANTVLETLAVSAVTAMTRTQTQTNSAVGPQVTRVHPMGMTRPLEGIQTSLVTLILIMGKMIMLELVMGTSRHPNVTATTGQAVG